MSIRSELLALKDRDAEILLNVDACISWAQQHPNSDLHKNLDWDDVNAAINWRRHQMRRLIAVHVTSPDTGRREFVSLSIDRTNGGGYRKTSDVERDRDLLDIVEGDVLAELSSLRRRHGHVRRLDSVWQAIDLANERWMKRRGRPRSDDLRASA